MKNSFMSISMLIVSISVVAMLLFSSVAHAQNTRGFIYDKQENTETVFTLDKTGRYLTPKLKYEFTYDESGNILTKEAFRWNVSDGQWQPYYLMNYTSTMDQQIIDYAVWNKETSDYTSHTQRTIFSVDMNNEILSYEHHKWDVVAAKWNVQQHLRMVDLFADRK